MAEHRKVTLISGGGRGIGAAIAARLAAKGQLVVAADRDIDGIAAPDGVRLVRADVSREDDVLALVNGIREREGRVDGLVCNAGFMIRKPISALSLDEWRSVVDTHVTSAFLMVRETKNLLRASHGAILTIASTRAHMSEPETESYAAAKGALLALTHALAISLGPHIRANCISPGWINSKNEPLSPQDHAQHPVGRVGRPEDIAQLAEFLLGPESEFITGSEFLADGGMTRKMIYTE